MFEVFIYGFIVGFLTRHFWYAIKPWVIKYFKKKNKKKTKE